MLLLLIFLGLLSLDWDRTTAINAKHIFPATLAGPLGKGKVIAIVPAETIPTKEHRTLLLVTGYIITMVSGKVNSIGLGPNDRVSPLFILVFLGPENIT